MKASFRSVQFLVFYPSPVVVVIYVNVDSKNRTYHFYGICVSKTIDWTNLK